MKWWRQRRAEEWTCAVTRKMEGVKQIVGKDSRYKLFWSGNDNATGGVGVLLAEEWWEVFEVVRVSDRIIFIRMTIGKTVFVFVCVSRRTNFTRCCNAQ